MSAGRQDTDYFGGGSAAGPNGPGMSGDGGAQMKPKYRFSPEEMRAIRECNRESFYKRCLPLGTLMGVGTWYAVKQGYLKSSARFGAGPKMFVASTLGYFLGKFSYQSVCAEKLMALPNSQLGEVLRKRKGQVGFQESLSFEPSFATPAPVGGPAFPNSEFSQSSSHSSHHYSDVGDTRPMMGYDSEGASNLSGYADFGQPSTYDTTQQMLDDENMPAKRPQLSTSYDDLRRQNRIDYETKQHSKQTPPSAPTPADSSHGFDGYQNRRSSPASVTGNDNKPKNKYGDVWEDSKTATY